MTTVDWIQKIFSIAQPATVLLAALIAAIKFKVFGLGREKFRTEMECGSQGTATEGALFWADYTVFNTGDLPFRIECVRLTLCRAKEENGGHLVPDTDREKLLASPTILARDKGQAQAMLGDLFEPKDHFKKLGALGDLDKGERTIFTLRCHVRAQLPYVIFVVAESWRSTWWKRLLTVKPKYSFFHHMYVEKSAETAPSSTSAQAASQ